MSEYIWYALKQLSAYFNVLYLRREDSLPGSTVSGNAKTSECGNGQNMDSTLFCVRSETGIYQALSYVS